VTNTFTKIEQGVREAVVLAPTIAPILMRLQDVLQRLEYPGYSFIIGHAGGEFGYFYLQVRCTALCNVENIPIQWKGRKWLLSEHMLDGELVQTALKAVLTALEHEARERFKYRGVAIFSPHYDIEKLVALHEQPDSTKERT
jgi:hypothetical protein